MGPVHNLLAFLSVFWTVLYAVRRHRRRSSKSSFLPAPTSSTPSLSPELFRTRTTRITLSNFHLGLHSTACNASHQYFATRLRRSRARTLLVLVFDAGSVLALFGMLASVVLLVCTTFQLALSFHLNSSQTHLPSTPLSLRKRQVSFDEISPVLSPSTSPNPPLQLIIPGVTTPLHHLPILLLALFATQIVHEAGHALAAALDSVLLTSAGLGLTVLLPSAFVSFSAQDTQSLPPRPRLRIISAGAFHNLLFWLFIAAITSANLSHILWPLLGYQDVSAYGRLVVHTDENSPLRAHLPIGSVIYKVGDAALDGPGGAATIWLSLLSNSRHPSMPALGWCVDEPWFAVQNATCCTVRRSEVSSQSCFAPTGDLPIERCVDPLLFLDPSDTSPSRRCTSAVDCGHSQLCIRPRGDQELVSLTMHLPPWLRTDEKDVERKLVWQGDPSEILHQVEVGDWMPGYRLLPLSLPVVWNTFIMYLKILSLSLYFFNLLPLPFLDGGQLFDLLCDWWGSLRSDGADGEALTLDRLEASPLDTERVLPTNPPSMPHRTERRKAVWRRLVHASVGTLTGCCVVLSFIKSL